MNYYEYEPEKSIHIKLQHGIPIFQKDVKNFTKYNLA